MVTCRCKVVFYKDNETFLVSCFSICDKFFKTLFVVDLIAVYKCFLLSSTRRRLQIIFLTYSTKDFLNRTCDLIIYQVSVVNNPLVRLVITPTYLIFFCHWE